MKTVWMIPGKRRYQLVEPIDDPRKHGATERSPGITSAHSHDANESTRAP